MASRQAQFLEELRTVRAQHEEERVAAALELNVKPAYQIMKRMHTASHTSEEAPQSRLVRVDALISAARVELAQHSAASDTDIG